MPENNDQTTLLSLKADLDRVSGLVSSLQTTVNQQATELTAAQTENKALKEQLQKRTAADKVAKLLADGKILPKQREQFEAIALSNSDWFDSFAATLEPVIALNQAHGTGTGSTQQNTPPDPNFKTTGDAALDQKIRTARGDDAISLMNELVAKRKKDENLAYGAAMNAVANDYPDLVDRYREAFVVAGTPGQVQ